ncbi:MAG: flagellar motor switch protein FliN [Phycisphaerales bacterium]
MAEPEAEDQQQDDAPESQPAPAGEANAAAEDSPEAALDAATRAVEELQTDSEALQLEAFGQTATPAGAAGIELLSKVNLNVRVELGRTRMLVEDVLRLNEGAVVELDKLAGDPVDIYVNDRLVACGEVLVLNDTFCVRISEIFDTPSQSEPAPARQATG